MAGVAADVVQPVQIALAGLVVVEDVGIGLLLLVLPPVQPLPQR